MKGLEILMYVLSGGLVAGGAALLARRVLMRGELGEVVAKSPSSLPKWMSYLFYFAAAARIFDSYLERGDGREGKWMGSAATAIIWLLLGVLFQLSARGLHICRGGIDFGHVSLIWRDVRSWHWSEDRTRLEFVTNSPWRFLVNTNPRGPIRYGTPYSEEIDSRLREFIPRTKDATSEA